MKTAPFFLLLVAVALLFYLFSHAHSFHAGQ